MDQTLLKNWRPITLLMSDYEILTKAGVEREISVWGGRGGGVKTSRFPYLALSGVDPMREKLIDP